MIRAKAVYNCVVFDTNGCRTGIFSVDNPEMASKVAANINAAMDANERAVREECDRVRKEANHAWATTMREVAKAMAPVGKEGNDTA